MKKIIFKSFIVLNTIVFSNLNIFAQSITSSIIGGVDININQAPYQVSLEDADGKHFGGGIILSDRWILSAHHLFEPLRQPASVTIHAGSTDQTNNAVGQRIVAQQIIRKIGWTNQIKESDLALIELSASLQFNENVQPIKYANLCNTTEADIRPNINAYLTGWGHQCPVTPNAGDTCPTAPTSLLKAITSQSVTSVNANQLIQARYPGFNIQVTDNMIAFYNLGTGATKGDSGGPAVIQKNDTKINAGVTSWVVNYQADSMPCMYANVRNYASWIETTSGIPASRSGVDLYLQDRPWDMANEPNNVDYAWMSEDIWVRNQADGFTVKEHQNPEFQTGAPVYVYVRVRNNGCQPSVGTENVSLYWAKAATDLLWPSAWNGSPIIPNGPLAGNLIQTKPVGIVQAGSSTIVEYLWTPPNPALYAGINPEPWHFCLLARVVAANDPMKFAETSDLNANVVKNNNIGWKNISIVDLIPYTGGGGEIRPGGVIAIGNMSSATTKYDFEFKSPAYALDHVYIEAEILLTLDAKSWQKWVAGGRRMQNVRVFNESRKQLLILGNNAWIRNLSYLRNERSTMKVSFNFLTQEATAQPEFDYIAVQRKSVGQAVVGGETFRIVKPNPNRQSFAANSQGAATIVKNDSTQLSATTIGEPAIYNWYNAQGMLIHSGATLKVSPAITEKYKLEVIALSDGFKDYDEVTVKVKQHEIKSISPNPVSNTATIVYKIENAVSAYLQLTSPFGNMSSNYILDVN